MPVDVRRLEDPGAVLDAAGDFLASRPVEHNAILTLLHARATRPVPGRYWIAEDAGSVLAVVFQSPRDYSAAVTPMDDAHVEAVVQEIDGEGVRLPGIIGEAPTAARFAGLWTEVTRSGAVPVGGQRLYALDRLALPAEVAGALRPALPADLSVVLEWSKAFSAETETPGRSADELAELVGRRLYWLWDAGGPVSMAAHTDPLAGVSRVHAVYTPLGHRGRGYAAACVGRLSERLAGEGLRCILYTDLANPTSNAIYRRLGYEAVSEVLRYRFIV